MTEEQLAKIKADDPSIQRANNYGMAKTIEAMRMAKVDIADLPNDRNRVVVMENRSFSTMFGTRQYKVGQLLDDDAEIETAIHAEIPVRFVTRRPEPVKKRTSTSEVTSGDSELSQGGDSPTPQVPARRKSHIV
jgi:hypothetical protein